MRLTPSAASVDPRWVELEGRVVALALLEAPLSGRACVLYRVSLGLLQRLRDGPGRAREVAGVRFLVRSEVGTVLVDPEPARIRLPTRLRHALRQGVDAARDLRVAALYQRLERGAPPGRVIACEQRLDPGDLVRLSGWLEETAHPLGEPDGYRLPPRLPLLRVDRLAA